MSDSEQANDSSNSILSKLIRKRAGIRSRVTYFKNFSSKFQIDKLDSVTSVEVRELSVKLAQLQELVSKFDEVQTEIEELSVNAEKEYSERDVTESEFSAQIALAQEIIDLVSIKNKNSTNNESIKSSCGVNASIKLPTINLPTFDGNFVKWLEFRDTFQSLIDDNDSIPIINKYHYLRNSLVGSAKIAISSTNFAAKDYKNAWQALCKRYDNPNILMNYHFNALINIAPIQKETFTALRDLSDIIFKNLSALNTLEICTDGWDPLIIHLVAAKLDPRTRNKWEDHKASLLSRPTLDEFQDFLIQRANVLQTAYHSHGNNDGKNSSKENSNRENRFVKSFATITDNTHNKACVVCDKNHYIHQCFKFKGMKLNDRHSLVNKQKLCINCLRSGHTHAECTLKGLCRKCSEKHNSLLHKTVINVATENTEPSATSVPVSLSAVSLGQVLLCTAQVEVVNIETNCTYLARALLDTGSQSSFMTGNLKEKLGLRTEKLNAFNVTGINNVACEITERCKIKLKSRIGMFSAHVSCFILPKITGNLPNIQINVERLGLPENIQLADPLFYHPSEIDILLGADHFFNIILPNKISLGTNRPVLQDSMLGWIVAGPTGQSQNNKKIHCNFVQNGLNIQQDLNDSLIKFWEVEDVPSEANIYSADEQFCESHFNKNTCRLPDGRFSVMMPLKEVPEQALGNSFPLAFKRFLNLETKLNKNHKLKEQYANFISEYAKLKHLVEINRPEFGCFLPHHCVIREQHETTKLRVVFDASAKTRSGKSLNDIQAVGPVMQNDLFLILIQFRLHKCVLTADVEKMYRQIELDESQRHLQLILWRDQPSEPIKILQLKTLTYGMASAPFLSTRCLFELGSQCSDKVIAEIIKNNFYMDDLITGASSEDELKHIYLGVSQVLNAACFPLRKFKTNCPKILNDNSESNNCLAFHDEATVLGLKWSPLSDKLQFPSGIEIPNKATKRIIISTTCKLFDPLGLVSCCIIKAKILLQNLWALKLDWDDPVPEHYVKKWFSFIKNLHLLSDIVLPRYVLGDNLDVQSVEMHCFVDASQQAYGACVYMCSNNNKDNTVTVRLLCAKTRVAPIKTLTIPRLELCAALIGSELCAKVLKSIPCNVRKIYMWTDSTVVLGWLKTQNKALQAFVRNRVNKINQLTKECEWKHVPTKFNPADLASRGIDPQHVQASVLWWEGPSFLKEGKSKWPTQPQLSLNNLPETKVLISVDETLDNINSFIQFDRFSSYLKIKRCFAYVLRFVHNCKKNTVKVLGPLQTEELDHSLTLLLKFSQLESFAKEIKIIKDGKALHHKSKLLPLNPFCDDNGLIRVGGRLDKSDCKYDKKHPILLDAKQHLTRLILHCEHSRLFHAGPQLLLSSVREKFWPLGGRNLARTIVKTCVVCTRFRGQPIQPLMGDLPSVRVNPGFPFSTCGIDFAGPFMISSKKGRGNRVTKAYLCVFVCLATKALHLEVVSDLTTEAFVSCLRRFVSRRGKPHAIYCDNGKNFVGANNELGRVIKASRQSVSDFASNEEIKFMFCPAYSPHFGGIWEAGVKSAKYHLKRVAGSASLTFEELATLFAQIEAILNSRPISPLSSDPTDLNPLTPGHFLIGRPLMSVPSLPANCIRPNRYQRIEQIRQQFWARWRREFMAELQNRTKWRRDQPSLQVGDLVVLREDNLMPLDWRMGRVMKIYPGKDGIVRVADVHTNKGLIKRAVQKMCLLPTTP